MWKTACKKHKIRGWIAVSAAGSHGQSWKESYCSQTPVSYHYIITSTARKGQSIAYFSRGLSGPPRPHAVVAAAAAAAAAAVPDGGRAARRARAGAAGLPRRTL